MYGRWIRHWGGYVCAFVTAGLIIVVAAEKWAGIPLRFTKSISYDVKVRFIRDRLPTSQFDTFVVGSSMALNTVDSALLEASTVSGKVLNLSSWGLGTSEALQLLQMIDLSNAKTVIYASQYFDYVGEVDKVLDESELRRYLNGKSVLKTYFLNISRLPGSLWDHWDFENVRGDSRTLGYLGFDDNGDVNIDPTDFVIFQPKWDRIPDVPTVPIGEEYYKHLVAMHAFLSLNGVRLVVVTNPFRSELIKRNPEFSRFFSAHRDYLRRLAKERNFTYIDAHSALELGDEYFMDAAHVHADGAVLLTKLVVEAIEQDQESGR